HRAGRRGAGTGRRGSEPLCPALARASQPSAWYATSRLLRDRGPAGTSALRGECRRAAVRDDLPALGRHAAQSGCDPAIQGQLRSRCTARTAAMKSLLTLALCLTTLPLAAQDQLS